MDYHGVTDCHAQGAGHRDTLPAAGRRPAATAHP